MQDDVQNGYTIPAGTAVIVNMWSVIRSFFLFVNWKFNLISFSFRGLLHDDNIYASPMVFDPERFVTTGKRSAEMDPHIILFGYGRR